MCQIQNGSFGYHFVVPWLVVLLVSINLNCLDLKFEFYFSGLNIPILHNGPLGKAYSYQSYKNGLAFSSYFTNNSKVQSVILDHFY